jgi:hypothetical protein
MELSESQAASQDVNSVSAYLKELDEQLAISKDVTMALVTLRSMIHFGDGVPAINILERHIAGLVEELAIQNEAIANYETTQARLETMVYDHAGKLTAERLAHEQTRKERDRLAKDVMSARDLYLMRIIDSENLVYRHQIEAWAREEK